MRPRDETAFDIINVSAFAALAREKFYEIWLSVKSLVSDSYNGLLPPPAGEVPEGGWGERKAL